jgi:hypothetical protein
MSSKRIMLALAAIGAFAAIGIFVYQRNTIRGLQLRIQQIDASAPKAPEPAPVEVPEALVDTNELARLRAQDRDLMRLRGEVTWLRRENVALSNRLAAIPRTKEFVTREPAQEVDDAWVQQILNGAPALMGATAGALRGKLIRGELTNVSPSELALQKALVQRQLNPALERSPAEFADFQTSFIQGVVGLSDGTKLQQIHDLIRQTYEHAVANGLDVASKPAADTEAWVQRRFQLDREATAAVEQLLTAEERRLFGRAFLGVMGVDLGGIGVDRSNYPKGFLGPE